ncbi:CPBP family intramembrane glutamic endopeptidase [Lysobacter sp. A3-1-A15]|uniref:CPBP family intramembrane glutamic endopeptidase n=1 Tax=Novilysobacter viscosus TaxID=3098602 RepID=UPI002ED7D224
MNILFDADRRLRNGWWMLVFIAFIAATRVVYAPLKAALAQLGVTEAWLEPVPFLLTLLATWAVLRLRRERLASVGFQMDRRWWRHAALGMALGMGSLLLAAGLILAIGGVRFQPDPERSLAALGYGLYVFLFVSLLEENLFRGFLFQRLVAGAGAWVAQIAFALLFAFGHWDNPGMDGTTRLVASIELGLAAILLGLAYLRTRSLALPIGIHLGWNWAQGYVLGFGVSGMDHPGWLQPVFQGQATWLTGGEFGPEASVLGILVDLLLIGLLWKWKGLAPASDAVPVAPVAATPTALPLNG